MQESARAWRLSVVLHDVRYPAEKWMILTAADTYGADVHSRTELHDLPENTYHDIDEVVAAVNHSVGRPTAASTLSDIRSRRRRA